MALLHNSISVVAAVQSMFLLLIVVALQSRTVLAQVFYYVMSKQLACRHCFFDGLVDTRTVLRLDVCALPRNSTLSLCMLPVPVLQYTTAAETSVCTMWMVGREL
jgi:hypothetical protein